jgi:predicted O-linked N-acetylglucosamine transferase (SPINDLY family)
VVALVEGRHANLTEMLKQRFQKTIADVAQRIRILPHMPWKDYLNLIAISDVMLDPLHFGGANTSYEGLAMGIPVVTLPPSFLRGRHTLGCYLKMGINECIASTPQHYADIALKLGTNADFRLYVVRKIEETSNALFENGEMAEALGSFLLHTCFEGG